MVTHVIDALNEFTQGTEPYDDVTLVALCRDPEEVRCADS